MKIKDTLTRLLAVGLALLIAIPLQALAQERCVDFSIRKVQTPAFRRADFITAIGMR